LRKELLLSAVSHRTVKWQGTAALVAFVALAAGIGQTSTGHAILRKAGLFEGQTSFTSLAFQHPQSLQEQVGSRQAAFGVSFIINNTGANSADYQWSVLVDQGPRAHRAASGSVRIASGHEAAITRSVKISCAQGRVRIVVTLARPAEFIDAWASCSSHRS
jgi:hypothetical protein